MNISTLAIKRPVTTTMLILVLLLFGLLAFTKLPVDLYPKAEFPYITITTVYPGAGPKEVETKISKIIEDEVATLSGIENIQSYSMNSVSNVMIKFSMKKDGDVANQEVKDKINAIVSDLPNKAEQPTVEKYDLQAQPVVELLLSGDKEMITPQKLFDYASNELKDRFAQIEGAAKINLFGGEEREIRINTDHKTLFENNITIGEISEAISSSNQEISGGSFKSYGKEISLTTDAEFNSLSELGELEIPLNSGYKKLKELAEVIDGSKDIKYKSKYYNLEEDYMKSNVVKMTIIKSSGANTVKLAEESVKLVNELKKTLPKGIKLDILHDNSIFINSSVSDTISNLVMGIILTGFILFFFLYDIRSTLIVAISMPTSIISTFMMLSRMGFSLNMMSLMGLSTAVGVLVSNSIVVLENIFRFKKMNYNNRESAMKGTAEVTTAVIASTATNLVVFLPIGSMSSMAGQFFKEFALTVCFATIFSLIISFTLTPLLANLLLPKEEKKNYFGAFMEKFHNFFEEKYEKVLKFVLKNKVRPIAFLVIMFVILSGVMIIIAPKIGIEFMPVLDEGDIIVKVELPQGTTIAESSKKINEIEKIIKKHKEVKNLLTTIGDQKGTHLANIAIKLVDVELRNKSAVTVNQLLINELSAISNVKITCKPNREEEEAINYFIIGPDKEVLESYMPELYRKMRKVKGLINFDSSYRKGKPQIKLIPKRRILNEIGLTAYDLAMTLYSATEGIKASIYRENGEEYDIRVSYDDASINSIREIASLVVLSPKGKYTLGQLAELKLAEGTNQIQHMNKLPTIELTGGVANGYALQDVSNSVRDVIESMNFPNEIYYRVGGNVEMMDDTNEDMAQAFVIAIILTYMLLASLLESFSQPFLILMTLPMATIGVFVLMFATGTTMNMFSMMAIIMLIGLVVNDAILILDYTKMLMKTQNLSAKEALLIAGPTKMKAVIMTTMAIILGMLPMALGIGSAGKEIRIPMAMVQIGGMITSTILTLLLIPALFYLTHKDKPIQDHPNKVM
jgi:HAE1 family hydrophobic/amphiphilic exporter-1